MLATFVVLYMLLMIPIGIYAASKVKTSEDFVLAGRHLPFFVVLGTTFATWFGSESVLGTASRMAESGLSAVVEDPFGFSLCLIVIGIFFAKPFYRLKFLTLGDLFEVHYGKLVAAILSVVIIISYFGWVAAQFVALGIILNLLMGIPIMWGILISVIIVLIYTYIGGMWSVALTDTLQMGVIIVALILVTIEVLGGAGGLNHVIAQTPDSFFTFFPNGASSHEKLAFLAALSIAMFGSIPQQDVYQRVMSAKNATVSMWASISAGILYLLMVSMPLLLGLAARLQYPELLEGDTQYMLPTLILEHTSIFTQILFFGALISAIMSTASATLLAPATLFGENVLRPMLSNLSDKNKLQIIRGSILLVAIGASILALNQGQIYELVVGAYSISLVSAFIPLVFALFVKSANKIGALFAAIFGFLGWQGVEHFGNADFIMPSVLVGLMLSAIGMILGILYEKITDRKMRSELHIQ
jgi:SSS family transporter